MKTVTVYWRVMQQKMQGYMVEFWTKEDKSDSLKNIMVTLEEAKMRARYEALTGKKRFVLKQVK